MIAIRAAIAALVVGYLGLHSEYLCVAIALIYVGFSIENQYEEEE